MRWFYEKKGFVSVVFIDFYFEWGEEVFEWVRRKVEVYEIVGFKFLVEKGRVMFMLFFFGFGCIKVMFLVMVWVVKDRDEVFDFMFFVSMREVLFGFKWFGLFLWDEIDELNVLVFRKDFI